MVRRGRVPIANPVEWVSANPQERAQVATANPLWGRALVRWGRLPMLTLSEGRANKVWLGNENDKTLKMINLARRAAVVRQGRVANQKHTLPLLFWAMLDNAAETSLKASSSARILSFVELDQKPLQMLYLVWGIFCWDLEMNYATKDPTLKLVHQSMHRVSDQSDQFRNYGSNTY